MFTFMKAAAVAALTLAASQAAAVSVISSSDTVLPSPILNTTPDSTTGTVSVGVTGTIFGFRRDPFLDTPLEDVGRYTSIQAGSSATYTFASPLDTFNILWGSPDQYNQVELYSMGTLVESFNGTIAQPPVRVGFNNISLSTQPYDTAVLISTRNAFEFSNLNAAPVPLPAAAWLLLSALGGVGILSRRRRHVPA